ncbi:MAG: sugar nucleotide-binding protein [Eubacteriales bacterium]
MEILVGHTGFVGSNLARKRTFSNIYNSKNIQDAFGTKPDLLVYSGVPAEMFLANNDPEADRVVTENAAANIRKINPKRLVLISTIAVLDNPVGTYEDTEIDAGKLTAYGLNRLNLERLAADAVENCHIIRLPALFGKGIKKNFIYDMINFFPALLNETKYSEFSAKESTVADSYILQSNGFYKLNVTDDNKSELKAAFERLNFSALNFTDSRSKYQFYNLANLWSHIEIVIKHEIPLLHTATEPISAADLYAFVFGKPFNNELTETPFDYDYRSKYAELFDGENGYISSKEKMLAEVKKFIRELIK